MNEMLTGDVRKLWKKYLLAALGSAIISSIYATVDLIIVGQYEGPNGAAAMAVIAPLWSVIMSIGIFFAVGGSVMWGVARGAGDKDGESFFTVTLVSSVAASLLLVALCQIFKEPLFRLFGADDALMPLVLSYADWLCWFLPFFLVGQVLIFFLRNDGAPVLATAAVASCGILNIFGDYLLVFTLDMGMEGAGIATVLCQTLAVIIMCCHFLRKKCTLRLVRPKSFAAQFAAIAKTGLSPFIVDFSIFIATVLFNNRIMRLSGAEELAVYGTAANIAIFALSILYGVGGAVQPLASANRGARQYDRMRRVMRLALISGGAIAAVFLLAAELLPVPLLRLYMDVTPTVLETGPAIVRIQSAGFVFMGVNIVASYYLQSVLCTKESLTVSLLRGVIVCVPLLFILPALFGFDAIWWTTPLSELAAFVTALFLLRRANRIED